MLGEVQGRLMETQRQHESILREVQDKEVYLQGIHRRIRIAELDRSALITASFGGVGVGGGGAGVGDGSVTRLGEDRDYRGTTTGGDEPHSPPQLDKSYVEEDSRSGPARRPSVKAHPPSEYGPRPTRLVDSFGARQREVRSRARAHSLPVTPNLAPHYSGRRPSRQLKRGQSARFYENDGGRNEPSGAIEEEVEEETSSDSDATEVSLKSKKQAPKKKKKNKKKKEREGNNEKLPRTEEYSEEEEEEQEEGSDVSISSSFRGSLAVSPIMKKPSRSVERSVSAHHFHSHGAAPVSRKDKWSEWMGQVDRQLNRSLHE